MHRKEGEGIEASNNTSYPHWHAGIAQKIDRNRRAHNFLRETRYR